MAESELTPPKAIVKVPIPHSRGGLSPHFYREGRGFSIGEIKAAGLTVKEARLLGLYVDVRRKSVYEENIKRIKNWKSIVEKYSIKPEPKLPKIIVAKRKRGRVFRGLTPAGKKSRGLVTLRGLKEIHKHKWKRKAKERKLKKRHEAKRAKGGH
ncbi:MAG TPA: hypothetical protein ENF87_01940 [Thermoproteales archaeon]|nr:hypothetical protein [Thermoproteales archaeon]